jgi:hypothetical protein
MSFEAKSGPSPAIIPAGSGNFPAPSPGDAGATLSVAAHEPAGLCGDPAGTAGSPAPHLASHLASPAGMSPVQACGIVRHLVDELLMLIGDRVQMRRDRRRALCHIRQIAMYVCHVSLGMPQSEIGEAFGRDRTTVGHACGVVEERRENAAFDDFVSTVERIANTVFGRSEVARHD